MYRNELFERVYYESLDPAEKLLYLMEKMAEEDEDIGTVLMEHFFLDHFADYTLQESYKNLVILIRTGIEAIRKRIENLNELFSVNIEADLNIEYASRAKEKIDKNTEEIEEISLEKLSKTEEIDVKGYCQVYFDQLTVLNRILRRYNVKHPDHQVEYVKEKKWG